HDHQLERADDPVARERPGGPQGRAVPQSEDGGRSARDAPVDLPRSEVQRGLADHLPEHQPDPQRGERGERPAHREEQARAAHQVAKAPCPERGENDPCHPPPASSMTTVATPVSKPPRRRRGTKLQRRQTRLAWLLLTPALIVVALVAMYPLGKT